MLRRLRLYLAVGGFVVVANIAGAGVLQLHAAEEEQVCPSPAPTCSEHRDCKNYTNCKTCFPNPLGLHCANF